jgi:hypothetical protein
MKFNIGDKVSFLNDKLSGKIAGIIKEGLYKVETEDGFEINAIEKELVLISKAESSELPSSIEIVKPLIEKITKFNSDLFSFLENDVVHFVSMPAEDMQVLTGAINYYLFNKTDYFLQFSFSVKINNNYFGLISDSMKPQSENLLINKKRSDMIDWQNFLLQFILFKKDELNLVSPFNKELPLLFPDLKTEFNQLQGMESYSKTMSLLTVGKEPEIDMQDLKRKFSKDEEAAKNDFKEKKSSAKTSLQQGFDDAAIIYNDAEVDLHIQDLVDDYKHLSNAEIMQIQLTKFRKEMDHAIKNHYHKIIFIHGVGNGVLRNEILRELRAYHGVRYVEAPFEKYGYGATEVILI